MASTNRQTCNCAFKLVVVLQGSSGDNVSTIKKLPPTHLRFGSWTQHLVWVEFLVVS